MIETISPLVPKSLPGSKKSLHVINNLLPPCLSQSIFLGRLTTLGLGQSDDIPSGSAPQQFLYM